jgi:hypothetical protein
MDTTSDALRLATLTAPTRSCATARTSGSPGRHPTDVARGCRSVSHPLGMMRVRWIGDPDPSIPILTELPHARITTWD